LPLAEDRAQIRPQPGRVVATNPRRDFPFNALLYGHLTPAAYGHWLRRLGVAYVVLTQSSLDYSSRQEAALVRSGRAGLRRVWASREVAVYAVPRPQLIVTGPDRPTVRAFRESRLVLHLSRGGTYAVAVRWSPYWQRRPGASPQRAAGCCV
jgi:hypothetical protein